LKMGGPEGYTSISGANRFTSWYRYPESTGTGRRRLCP
jgi:hypothetical protein